MLNINAISKHFGRIKVISHLQLDIAEGEVFGLLRPNGAG